MKGIPQFWACAMGHVDVIAELITEGECRGKGFGNEEGNGVRNRLCFDRRCNRTQFVPKTNKHIF